MEITIRKAMPDDCQVLTELSFASKRYWNYPDSFFEVWKDELTITREYLAANRVYVAVVTNEIIGYFSVVEVRHSFFAGNVFIHKGFWLEHMFIKPSYIRAGIGTKLIIFARELCHGDGIDGLFLFADPHARGFYDKVGADYLGESSSNIEGRNVSLFRLHL